MNTKGQKRRVKEEELIQKPVRQQAPQVQRVEKVKTAYQAPATQPQPVQKQSPARVAKPVQNWNIQPDRGFAIDVPVRNWDRGFAIDVPVQSGNNGLSNYPYRLPDNSMGNQRVQGNNLLQTMEERRSRDVLAPPPKVGQDTQHTLRKRENGTSDAWYIPNEDAGRVSASTGFAKQNSANPMSVNASRGRCVNGDSGESADALPQLVQAWRNQHPYPNREGEGVGRVSARVGFTTKGSETTRTHTQ